MEVRPGYKQTEIGVFPTEWEIAPLAKHATFRTGPFGSALHKSDYTSDGVPVVNPMHIVDGGIAPTRTMTITEMAAKNLSDFRMSPGEIVIGRRGDMGRCAVVQELHAGWLCGTGSMIIRPLNADADFLQRVLSSPRAISAIEDSSVGTTMVNLNQGTLGGLKVQFPPLPEQRAIAAALRDVDALLGGLDRLIAKKRDLKQAAMQQLLTGQTRLPGFHGEWEVKRLGDIAKLYQPETISQSEFTDYGYPVFGANGVVGMYGRFNHQSAQITISCRGNCGTVNRTQGPAWITGNAMVVNLDESTDVDKAFIYYALAYSDLSILVTGSGIPQIVRDPLAAFAVTLPADLAEQTSIAAVLADMDAELAALETRRDKTRALKQAMMQELLTGRTRLV